MCLCPEKLSKVRAWCFYSLLLYIRSICTDLRENVLGENVLPCSSAALCSRNLRRAECMRSSVVSPTPMKPRTGRVAWSAWPFSKINAEYPPVEPRFLAVSKTSRNKQIHKKKNQSFTTVSLKETNKTPCFVPASFGDFVFKKRPNKAPCFCIRNFSAGQGICTRL